MPETLHTTMKLVFSVSGRSHAYAAAVLGGEMFIATGHDIREVATRMLDWAQDAGHDLGDVCVHSYVDGGWPRTAVRGMTTAAGSTVAVEGSRSAHQETRDAMNDLQRRYPVPDPRKLDPVIDTEHWSGLDPAWVSRWCGSPSVSRMLVSGGLPEPGSAEVPGMLTVFTDASVEIHGSRTPVSAGSFVVPELGLCAAFLIPPDLCSPRSPYTAEAATMCAAVDLLAGLGVPMFLLTDSMDARRWWAGTRMRDERIPPRLWDLRIDLHRKHKHLVSPGWVRGHNGTPGNEWADRTAKAVMRASRDKVADRLAAQHLAGVADAVSASLSNGAAGMREVG